MHAYVCLCTCIPALAWNAKNGPFPLPHFEYPTLVGGRWLRALMHIYTLSPSPVLLPLGPVCGRRATPSPRVPAVRAPEKHVKPRSLLTAGHVVAFIRHSQPSG